MFFNVTYTLHIVYIVKFAIVLKGDKKAHFKSSDPPLNLGVSEGATPIPKLLQCTQVLIFLSKKVRNRAFYYGFAQSNNEYTHVQ